MPARIQSHKLATKDMTLNLSMNQGKTTQLTTCLNTLYSKQHHCQQQIQYSTHIIVREDLPNALTTEEIWAATATDKTLQQLMSAINKGYIPAENKQLLQPYNLVFPELSTTQEIILHGTWLLIPETLQDKAISLAHEGHMGTVKTKRYLCRGGSRFLSD